MQDSEFIADLALALEKGIIQKSSKAFEDLYKQYDSEFPYEKKYFQLINDFFEFLVVDLEPIHNTFIIC